MITPLMALAPDINGVCNTEGTCGYHLHSQKTGQDNDEYLLPVGINEIQELISIVHVINRL